MISLINKLRENREIWGDKTPCFVVDSSIILENIKRFYENLDGEIAYSYKTNPHPKIAQIIHNSGCNFTICSLEELEDLHQLFRDVSNVIYLSPTLDEQELQEVLKLGVRRISIDSPSQIGIAVPNAQHLDEVFLRVATGSKVPKEDFIYEKISYLGIPIDEALPYLETLLKAQVKLGIHNHLSSQNTDLESWQQNFEILYNLIKEAKERGIPLYSVNLGGGFPIQYNEPVPSLEEITEDIKEFQEKVKSHYPTIKFIFEPGRGLVGDAAAFITKVKQKKRFNGGDVLIVDGSTYTASMDTLIIGLQLPYAAIHQNETQNRPIENYVIRGRSPCSLDIFLRNALLPKIEVGDYVVFLNAGAYNFSSDFVSMKKPYVIFLEGK